MPLYDISHRLSADYEIIFAINHERMDLLKIKIIVMILACLSMASGTFLLVQIIRLLN